MVKETVLLLILKFKNSIGLIRQYQQIKSEYLLTK